MARPALVVERLAKQYRVGETLSSGHDTLYDTLAGLLRRKRRAGSSSTFWALQDVGFEAHPGEVLGVVGRNGAGKSTLLKILSRITAPTEGRITLRGRVASLLEVGTGFHPELTGRENIHLSATILGMRRREIESKFDAIVAFAGIDQFLDTPVKRYSSGMYVRLAFAVAAHVDADILLVDEVLAVGDAEFQKRCLGVMEDVARGGRCVLFVSHNLTALRNLCTTGLLLEGGRVAGRGPIESVLAQYAGAGARGDARAAEFTAPAEAPAALTRFSVAPDPPGVPFTVENGFVLRIEMDVRRGPAEFGVFLHCYDGSYNRVFSSGSFFDGSLLGRKLDAGSHVFECRVPGHLLNAGTYQFDLMLVRERAEIVQSQPAALVLTIGEPASGIEGWHWPVLGVIRPELAWSCDVAPGAGG